MPNELEKRIKLLENRLDQFMYSDRFIMQRDIEMFDRNNFVFSKKFGTKIGTATTQKISFHGVTPVIQASAISAPSGGATVDVESRSKINEIRTVLSNKGFTA